MASVRAPQLNVRSPVAVQRARDLSRATGLTTTRIVEDALLAYMPPTAVRPVEGLVRRGRLLVGTGNHRVSRAEVQASIDATREGLTD